MVKPPKWTKYSQAWKETYHERYPCLEQYTYCGITGKRVVDTYRATCTICKCHFGVSHSSLTDCRHHCEFDSHLQNPPKHKGVQKLSNFVESKPESSDELKSIQSAALLGLYLVESNQSMRSADILTKLMPRMFPDSTIASKLSSSRSKTTAVIKVNINISTDKFITSGHFSIDGGKPLSKTYPILVYGFDPMQENIVWKMLDFGTLHIEDQATGENIFALLSEAVVSNAISWEHCLALNFDNANILPGDKKGGFGRLCSMQPACHLSRCVCHLLNLTAQVGSAEMNYDVNNLLQDIWHYLDKPNVRQGSLHKMQGENTKKMLRNAPSKWLDLGRHCPRLFNEWDSLNQFVEEEKAAASQEGSKADNEEVEAQQRTQKTRLACIEECLNSRECKLEVVFLDYVMAELFDPVNKHFQSVEPLITSARGSLEGFICKLQSGFV